MSKKLLTLFAALFTFGVVLSALAQDQSSGPTAAVDNQGIRGYVLGPGDVLDVRVFGQPDLSSVVEIDDQGQISSLPFLETPIPAQCRTEKEVQRDITAAYAKYIRNPQVSVRIQERKSRPPATISGAVRNPMQVTMFRRARLHELVTKAGGWTDRASGTIQIMHTQPEMCPEPEVVFQKASAEPIKASTDPAKTSTEPAKTSTEPAKTNAEQAKTSAEPAKASTELAKTSVELTTGTFGVAVYKISDLKMGKEAADPFIRPGDIVIVTEGEPVYVTGSVMGPRELVLRDQLTLGRAIAMAGGPQKMANTSEVHIYRQKDGVVGQEDLKINYGEIKKGKQPDVLLKAYDIIDVGESGIFSKKGMTELFTNSFRSTMSLATTRAFIY
jgi:polysaccharide export outer membrane protein